MENRNWAEAIESLRKCVLLAPENLKFRQRLRECEYKQPQALWFVPFGLRRFLKPQWIESELQTALAEEDWWYLDWLSEYALVRKPCDVRLNMYVGMAAQNRGHADVALFGYLCAYRANPRRKELKDKLEELGHKVLA